MTLSAIIEELSKIGYKVTSTQFETNVESIDPIITGDWKNWIVNFKTNSEDQAYEDGFNNGFESAKREIINKADIWLRRHLPRVLDKYYPEGDNDVPDADVLNEDMREDFRKAMEE